LTKRENRFAHHPLSGSPSGFPFDIAGRNQAPGGIGFGSDAELKPMDGPRLGDDVLLTNVLSFDVQVYDPGAPFARTPEDPSYAPPAVGPTTIYGAYVNLGADHYSRFVYPNAQFCADPNSIFNVTQIGVTIHPGATGVNLTPRGITGAFTYDTWSLHYENNGLREHPAMNFPSGSPRSGSPRMDAATNGLDDDNNDVVDDATFADAATGRLQGEAETAPPFPAPLRGIRVRIRVYEPDSRQVRQVTVVQDFLPD